MTGDLQFDAGSHTFTWRGQDAPGVSRIMRDMGMSTTWYKDDPKYVERGSAVHAATLLVNDDEYDEQGTHPELIPYIRNYQKFRSDTGYRAASGAETPIYSPSLKTAGIPDQWGWMGVTKANSGTLRTDDPYLLDIKTGEQKPPGVELQLGFYRMMLSDGVNIHGERVYLKFSGAKCLLLPSKGDYKLIDCSDPKWMRMAAGLAEMWHLRKAWGLLPRNGKERS